MATGMFTDKVKILIKAGNGGDGMNSFKAFKGKPACGPDGGDGGKGGNIYFVGDKDMTDLFSFRFKSKFEAGDGEKGGTNRCFGKGGADVEIAVPLGTLVKDAETGRIVCDVFSDGEKILVARGGNGGKGNVRFTTARRHAPNFAQKGERTFPHYVILEMKVIADVGLIGFPMITGNISFFTDRFPFVICFSIYSIIFAYFLLSFLLISNFVINCKKSTYGSVRVLVLSCNSGEKLICSEFSINWAYVSINPVLDAGK